MADARIEQFALAKEQDPFLPCADVFKADSAGLLLHFYQLQKNA